MPMKKKNTILKLLRTSEPSRDRSVSLIGQSMRTAAGHLDLTIAVAI